VRRVIEGCFLRLPEQTLLGGCSSLNPLVLIASVPLVPLQSAKQLIAETEEEMAVSQLLMGATMLDLARSGRIDLLGAAEDHLKVSVPQAWTSLPSVSQVLLPLSPLSGGHAPARSSCSPSSFLLHHILRSLLFCTAPCGWHRSLVLLGAPAGGRAPVAGKIVCLLGR
jgi:hypothetical protein